MLSDATFIRFLYAGDFKLEECTRRLRVWDEWNKDPNIQMMSAKARSILETGVLYTYGRDPMYRPIIFLNVAKTDLSKVPLILSVALCRRLLLCSQPPTETCNGVHVRPWKSLELDNDH